MTCSIYDGIIQKIKNDIEILERNKELSLKNNDNERYLAILDELKKIHKILNMYILKNEELKIERYNYNKTREYLYGNKSSSDIVKEQQKAIQIKTNYNVYLSNFNKSNKIKGNSYLSNFK